MRQVKATFDTHVCVSFKGNKSKYKSHQLPETNKHHETKGNFLTLILLLIEGGGV